MIGAVLGLVSLVLVLLWCYYRWRYRRILNIASKLYRGGLPCYPIVGHLPQLLFNPDYVGMVFRMQQILSLKVNESGCIWLGPFPIIFVASAEDIRRVATSSCTSEKSFEYSFIKPGLGEGLLTAHSRTHKITRPHFNPFFTLRNLEQLDIVFNESVHHLVHGLSQLVDQGLVDIFPLVRRIALRNVSCAMFGPDVDIDNYTEELEEMRKTVQRITDLLPQRMLNFWLWPDFLFRYLCSKEIIEIHTAMKNYANIPQKAYKDMLNSHKNHIHESKSGTYLNTFKSFREKYPEFTEQQWLDEVTTLAITATDTTEVVIPHCLLALALHPEIQDRLYQEVTSVVGVEDKDITAQNIKDMPYLDQVFKEALRHSSVVPIIARTTVKDIKLKHFTVPAGNTVVMSLASLNYNPEVFSNPYEFDPDHFAPERVAQMGSYSFVPFSGGTRNCIGKNYANLFVKIAIAQVVRKYCLTSTVDMNKMTYHLGLTIYSKDGYHLELEHRHPPLNYSF